MHVKLCSKPCPRVIAGCLCHCAGNTTQVAMVRQQFQVLQAALEDEKNKTRLHLIHAASFSVCRMFFRVSLGMY